ncbi:hypothetical protein [Streptomyces sp. NPDC088762]|uniref:hypothetical protein n=1 Tax=Streptomyces sp. NPDC088762 TaxID=3365891 RepID=UPI0038166E87
MEYSPKRRMCSVRYGERDAAGAAKASAALLEDQVRVLDPDDPEIRVTLHNLARWHGEAGDAAGAAAALAGLLEDLLRVLGPDHPNTLATRANLDHWREEAEERDLKNGNDRS